MEFIKSSKLNLLLHNEPWGVGGGAAGAEESTAVAKESGDPVAKLKYKVGRNGWSPIKCKKLFFAKSCQIQYKS